ncbi:MAG: hypothetical protein NC453_19355 [Muribaculum sp.]|nr:hypothetical protein [Muribaculum sp.]
MDKRKEMTDWLEANPGKSKRDWLLEVRCNSDVQREDLRALFARIDENNYPDFYILPLAHRITIYDCEAGYPDAVKTDNLQNERNVKVEFDFKFGGWYYDLDTPEEIYKADRYQMIWEFFRWKAQQMGLQDTTMVYECQQYYSQMRDGWSHWRNLLLPKE